VDDLGASSSDGACVLVAAPLGHIVAAGGSSADLLGLTGRDLAFLSLRDLVHPEDRTSLVEAMTRAVRHEVTTEVEVRVRARSRWINVRAAVDPPGRGAGGRVDRWAIRLLSAGPAPERGSGTVPAASPIERAILRGELDLDFQPIVTITSREVVCLEGLVRWCRPGGVRLSPRSFLPQAEELGVMDQVMRRVLHLGCEALLTGGPGVPAVSVNVSTSQLVHPAFLADLACVLERTGADPQRLTLELTGLDAGADLDDVARILGRAVTEAGVRAALDDVGAASSSVGALTRLPIEVVKIDRSFTAVAARPGSRRERDALGGLVDLAHRLGCQVVAEGVETDEQLGVAREAGVDHVQGFLLGRPGPLHALATGARSVPRIDLTPSGAVHRR
jgi:EAL domain-containing protein (putative c-di-GMP-specific phosphodiesterase class I)